ncbi:MAG: ZIP family metal transporter [Armatimonadota bacterium]
MLTVLMYSVIVVLAAWVGGLAPLKRDWRAQQLRLVVSFAAGVLLGAAFLHMLPEATRTIGAGAGGVVLLGFLALFTVEKFVMLHACHHDVNDAARHVAGLAAFVGLSIHSLVAGFALGSAVLLDERDHLHLGFVVVVAIVAHKLPESLSLMAALLGAGYSKRRTAGLIVFFSLMVPVGAFAVVLLARGVTDTLIAVLVALSAGTFIHIAAADLLPSVHRAEEGRSASLLTFLLGAGFMWATSLIH